MSSEIVVKISPELSARVNRLAERQGKTAGKLAGELLEEYVKDNDIGAYIDDLWDRINRLLKEKKVELSDIEEAVTASRKKQ